MTNATKLPPDQRSALILTAAVKVANDSGLAEVTFKTVAKACVMSTTPRTVQHYFKIGDLRAAVVADPRASQEVRDDAVSMGMS